MPLFTLGKVTVTTPGTIVQLSTSVLNCNTAYFQALSSNTGKIYVGVAGLNKATGAGLLRVIEPPTSSPTTLDSWNPASGVSVAPIDFSKLYIDADNPSEGLLISYLVT
jgi:hypothetical protein